MQPIIQRFSTPRFASCALLLAVACWAYWPTLTLLMHAWRNEPDYSHGFLVPIVASCMLWFRRESCPKAADRLAYGGLGMLVLSLILRTVSGIWFFDAGDGWALLFWIAGVVWLFAGRDVLIWASPAVIFLTFMIPLPFRLEHSLSGPLQRMATLGSAWILQTIGQPAFAEGNTILLGDHALEVERACAGLRIFMGIVAAAFAWSVFGAKHWFDRVLLVASALPVAIAANVLRIVITALCFVYSPAWFAERVAHDAAGWLMVPLAAVLMGAVHWYLRKLWTETSEVRMTDVVHRHRSIAATK